MKTNDQRFIEMNVSVEGGGIHVGNETDVEFYTVDWLIQHFVFYVVMLIFD